jgi:hypothetical protein
MDRVQVKRFYTDEVGVRLFGWQEIAVAEALKLAEPRLRCPECEGAVRLHQASSDGKMAAHAEHWKINRGCSLGDEYEGVPKMADRRLT